MDELTRERFLLGVPSSERYRMPGPLRRKVRRADWTTIEERRRVLDEALHKKTPPLPLAGRGGWSGSASEPATKGA